MRKTTLTQVIEALDHCSDEQEKAFMGHLNEGLSTWAGVTLGHIVEDHLQSLAEDTGPTEFELDTEAGFKRSE
jgi:hypothetical protein